MICIVAVLLQTLIMNALHVVLFSVAALLGLGVLVHSKQIMGGQYYEQQPVMHQQVGYGMDTGYGYGGDMGGYVMMPAGYGYGHGGGGVSLNLGGGGLGGSMWLWIIGEYFFMQCVI